MLYKTVYSRAPEEANNKREFTLFGDTAPILVRTVLDSDSVSSLLTTETVFRPTTFEHGYEPRLQMSSATFRDWGEVCFCTFGRPFIPDGVINPELMSYVVRPEDLFYERLNPQGLVSCYFGPFNIWISELNFRKDVARLIWIEADFIDPESYRVIPNLGDLELSEFEIGYRLTTQVPLLSTSY